MVSHLSYNKGFVYLGNTQGYFLPMNTFLLILKQINDNESPDSFKEFLRESTKRDSLFLALQQEHNKSYSQKLSFFLEYLNSQGFGEVKLNYAQKNKVVFVQDSILLTSLYKKLHGTSPSIFLEELVTGFITYFLSAHYRKKVQVEIQEVNNKLLYTCLVLEDPFDEIFSLDLYEKKESTKVNRVVRNVAVNQHIKIEKGALRIWGVYAVFVPSHFILSLCSFLSKEYDQFFANLGYMQGKWAIDIQRNVFGVKDATALFNQIVEQSDLVGYGPFRFEKVGDEVEFKLYENLLTHFSSFYDSSAILKLVLYMLNNLKGGYDFAHEIFTTMNITDLNVMLSIVDHQVRPITKEQEILAQVLNSKALM